MLSKYLDRTGSYIRGTLICEWFTIFAEPITASCSLKLMTPQPNPNFSSSLLGSIVSILVFVMHHPEGFQMNKIYYNSSGFGVSWFQPPFSPFLISHFTPHPENVELQSKNLKKNFKVWNFSTPKVLLIILGKNQYVQGTFLAAMSRAEWHSVNHAEKGGYY